jgi:hypothetical protein
MGPGQGPTKAHSGLMQFKMVSAETTRTHSGYINTDRVCHVIPQHAELMTKPNPYRPQNHVLIPYLSFRVLCVLFADAS